MDGSVENGLILLRFLILVLVLNEFSDSIIVFFLLLFFIFRVIDFFTDDLVREEVNFRVEYFIWFYGSDPIKFSIFRLGEC